LLAERRTGLEQRPQILDPMPANGLRITAMPTARTTGSGAVKPSSDSTTSRMVTILRMSIIGSPSLSCPVIASEAKQFRRAERANVEIASSLRPSQ